MEGERKGGGDAWDETGLRGMVGGGRCCCNRGRPGALRVVGVGIELERIRQIYLFGFFCGEDFDLEEWMWLASSCPGSIPSSYSDASHRRWESIRSFTSYCS